MKFVFVFLVAFCAVQCFGASIANNEESNKTYGDNQRACVLKALADAKAAVKEGKDQCKNDKKCLIKLAIRVIVNLWNDLKKCRNNVVFVLGEPRMTDTDSDADIWKLIDEIVNKFGDQLPDDITDLLEEIKKIVKGDPGADKTDCDKQRRHESEKLSDFVMEETANCISASDMEKCVKRVLFRFAEKQEEIDAEYQKCMGSNKMSKSTVFSENRNRRECLVKAVLKACRSWREGKGKCDNRDCIKQLVIQIVKDLKQDIKNCRDYIVFVFGEPRITDEEILTLMDDISNMFGDVPPTEIIDLLQEFLIVLNPSPEEENTECYQQKRNDLFKLGQEVVDKIEACVWQKKCIAEHMVIFSKIQKKIEEEYKECSKKNL